MALIPCAECGREVSDQAVACPNCGHPINKRHAQAPPAIPPFQTASAVASKRNNTGCAVIIALIVILVVVASCLPSAEKANTAEQSRQVTAQETAEARRQRLLAEAKDESRPLESRLVSARSLEQSAQELDERKQATALVNDLADAVQKANIGKQWRYWSLNDPMTSKSAFGAEVLSSNTHEFDFPYKGAQHATLILRRHPQHGNDVIMRIERGQLQCTSYSGCTVMVRFGEAAARRYQAYGPADNSSESLFIEGYADFLRRMQNADTVRIQASVFQQGSPAWEFDVRGYDPSKHQ